MAVEASLTGHLVFSTLHTNSAPETIVRLLDMGIDTFNFADALLGVLAQRLVRVLCHACKAPYTANEADCRALEVDPASPPTLYKAVGCDACNQLGYQGRTGIYELLEVDDHMAQMVHDGAGEHEIERYVRASAPSLRQDGARIVLNGDTALEEVLRVTRED